MGFSSVGSLLLSLVLSLVFSLSQACLALPAATEAPYPSRTIHVLVGIPPGGAPDVVARVQATTLPEFLDYARNANPPLAFASGGVGSQQHFAMELLKQRTGIDLLNVTYRGGTPAMLATIAGETQVLFTGGESSAQFKAGKLRGLAVSGRQRSKGFPELPTIGEFDPGYAVDIWLGLFAPAGTQEAVIAALRQEVQALIARPDVAAKSMYREVLRR